METCHIFKQAKSIPEDRKIQDGNPRINKDISKCILQLTQDDESIGGLPTDLKSTNSPPLDSG